MAELVYAFDLKSNGAIRTGSSPVSATIFVVVARRQAACRFLSREISYLKTHLD